MPNQDNKPTTTAELKVLKIQDLEELRKTDLHCYVFFLQFLKFVILYEDTSGSQKILCLRSPGGLQKQRVLGSPSFSEAAGPQGGQRTCPFKGLPAGIHVARQGSENAC